MVLASLERLIVLEEVGLLVRRIDAVARGTVEVEVYVYAVLPSQLDDTVDLGDAFLVDGVPVIA